MHRPIQILIQLWMYNTDALHSIGRFLPGWCDAQRLDGKFKQGCSWTFTQLMRYDEAGKLSQMATAGSVLTRRLPLDFSSVDTDRVGRTQLLSQRSACTPFRRRTDRDHSASFSWSPVGSQTCTMLASSFELEKDLHQSWPVPFVSMLHRMLTTTLSSLQH